MKLSTIVAAAALAFVAAQAGAVTVSSVTAVPSNYSHQSFSTVAGSYTVSGFATYTVGVPSVAAMPTGSGSFSAVTNSTATVTFASNYSGSFTFEWGTPSVYDTLTSSDGFTGLATGSSISGSSSLIGGANPVDSSTGNTQYDKLVTLTDLAGKTLSFTSTQAAFEVAAPVPEPETYALMLAGLGALGVMARRRKAA